MSPAAARPSPTKRRPTPPLPPPSPKILHFPLSRRTRRRKNIAHHHNANPSLLTHEHYLSGKLENLFDQENDHEHLTVHSSPLDFLHSKLVCPRRERVEEDEEEDDDNCGGGLEEEKWRFQAEMLRAECNLLRMERVFAFKKLDKNRVKMETTLRSAVDSLVSGRKKISEGEDVKAVLEEEIEDFAEKLEVMHKTSRHKPYQLTNCTNFDTKANLLQRHLEELRGLSEEHCSSKPENKFNYGRKMGDYNSSVLTSAPNSCASTSKRMSDEFPEIKCSGQCKTVVRRVAELVRAETEQWSQMQEMLRQVRGEMEELQASRDFWESRAHSSDSEVRSLRNTLEEWKEKAHALDNKVNELQLQLYAVKWDIQKSRAGSKANQEVPTLPLREQLENEKQHAFSLRRLKKNHSVNENCEVDNAVEEHKGDITLDKDSSPLSLGKQLAKEKKMFLHRLKENRHASRKNSREEMSTDAKSNLCSNRVTSEHLPLKDIGNSSCLARKGSRAACGSPPETFRTRESFRK